MKSFFVELSFLRLIEDLKEDDNDTFLKEIESSWKTNSHYEKLENEKISRLFESDGEIIESQRNYS